MAAGEASGIAASETSSVNRFRLTSIWPCMLPGLLRDGDGGHEQRLAGLAHPSSYRSLFGDLLTSAGDAPLGVPWADPIEHKFWREFTTHERDAVPDEVTPRNASRFVVPLHCRADGTDLPDCPPWKLSCHAFLYPFGPAIVVHAEYPHPDSPQRGGAVPLEDLVEACYDLRDGGSAADPSYWDRFVRERAGAVAPDYAASPGDALLGASLTVATFLEADIRALSNRLRDRVLNALTVWPERPVWRDAQLTERLKVALGPRHAASGRMIHAARRGRAVWFPDGFAAGGSMSEMHRRLTFVTMQTEMLARFLSVTAERPDLSALAPSWSDWAQVAAQAIGPLYAGKLAAADSTSPTLQVESGGGKDGINRIRRFFAFEDLH